MSRPVPPAAMHYTQIQDLYAYYTLCSDAGDADGFVSCFCADGELRIPALALRVVGHAALQRFKSEDKARRGGRVRRHWNSGLHLAQIDAGTVRGRCYLHAWEGEAGHMQALVDIGVYDDTLRLEHGHWCFAVREIHMDYSQFTAPESAEEGT